MADTKISALTDGTVPSTTDAAAFARAGGTTVKLTWAELLTRMPGYEVGYDQITSTVTVSSTTESAGTTIISCAAHTFDGNPVIAAFRAPYISNAGNFLTICLFEGATEICQIAVYVAVGNIPGLAEIRFTPTAGSHTYTVTGVRGSANGTVGAGAGTGGAGVLAPAFIRFTKV